jgi:hypothetical protein
MSFTTAVRYVSGMIVLGICGLASFQPETFRGSAKIRPIADRQGDCVGPETGCDKVPGEPLAANSVIVSAVESNANQKTTEVPQDREGTEGPKVDPHARLREKVSRLERGRNALLGMDGYSAIIQKQEVVNGVLLDEQTISIKCRNRPFSVYLLWLAGDVGREVIYIEGQNNGKMIAHDGGWKARIPAFHLPVDCMLAMRDARYPVTTAGLLGLVDIMRSVHEQDLVLSNVKSCEIDEDQQFDGRTCAVFTTRYKSIQDSAVYRKSITYVDRELNIPLHSRHFEWSAGEIGEDEEECDKATLIECYSFTSLNMDCHFTDADFDRANPEYHFR